MLRVHPGCARTTSEPAHHECAGFHHVRHVDEQSAAGKYGECRCVSAYPAKQRPSKAASHWSRRRPATRTRLADDRKSVTEGKSVSVRVEPGGSIIIQKKRYN